MADPTIELHSAALAFHKALLDAVRVDYEKEHGRVANPNALLGLVLSHESFAWLRQLSGLIVEIDEMQETPGADARDHAAARAAFEELLSRSGARFQEPFEAALHASPDVAGAYARLQRALEALPEPRSEDLTALHERRLKWGAPRRRASADRSNESS